MGMRVPYAQGRNISQGTVTKATCMILSVIRDQAVSHHCPVVHPQTPCWNYNATCDLLLLNTYLYCATITNNKLTHFPITILLLLLLLFCLISLECTFYKCIELALFNFLVSRTVPGTW